MERYTLIKELGDGTFGCVWRALNKQTGEVVAIKKMKKKYYSWEECVNLREVKSLRKMNHPNIVKLKEVIRENNILFFVFECMECNLYQLIKDKEKPFSETEVRNWCFQVFQGLAHMHQRGYFHRDLKPENLLVTKDLIKLADFGLAREISSNPPYTEYVSTRWYRAPEVLFQSYLYGPKVDMWAMGAIMAELFTLRPLFPGASETDQVYKICSILGTPTVESWADGLYLSREINYQFPQFNGVHLSLVIPTASDDAVNLIASLCSWDPSNRPTAMEALQHPFFQSCYYVPPSLRARVPVARTPPPAGTRSLLEQHTAKKYPVGPLSDSRVNNNFTSPKMPALLSTGVQRKLDLLNQDANNKNEKLMKNPVRQQKYRPPMRNSLNNSIYKGSSNVRGGVVSETVEKLANMTIGNHKQQQQQLPRPMKAGVRWGGSSNDLFLRPTREIQPPANYYPRKVAG